MSDQEVRHDWISFRQLVSDRAVPTKESQAALFALFDRYRALPPHEREVIDRVVADDLCSDDEPTRFDALAIIREFRIRSALPALRTLADRLEEASEHGASYEWAKVNRVIGALVSGQEP